MSKQPITQAEIKELEQVLCDLKFMQLTLTKHTKRVEAIIEKYKAPKDAAALNREKKKQERDLRRASIKFSVEQHAQIRLVRSQIKGLKKNPAPGSERQIIEYENYLRSMGKL